MLQRTLDYDHRCAEHEHERERIMARNEWCAVNWCARRCAVESPMVCWWLVPTTRTRLIGTAARSQNQRMNRTTRKSVGQWLPFRSSPFMPAVPRLNVTKSAMPKSLAAIVCFAMSWCVLAAQTHADSPTIDDNATVEEIVETLIKRHGGKNASDHWKCGTVRFTTTAGILPPGMGTATVTESFAFPSFFRRSIVADSPDGEIDLTFIINKDGGWMTSPGRPTMEMPRAFADRERHTFADIAQWPIFETTLRT